MVTELTTKCLEQCTHCFVDAKPDGQHMNHLVLRDLNKFIFKIQPPMVQISGGEFTEHPQFFEFCKILISDNKNTMFVLESNGSFYKDDEKCTKIKTLLKYKNVFALQIRTDKRYYPNYEEIINKKSLIESIDQKVKVFEGSINLVPLGRAKNLISENATKSPMCSNLIFLNKQRDFKSLKEFIHTYQSLGKFCVPSIDPNGYVHAGESRLCSVVGHISDKQDLILNNIKKHDFCGKCNLKINYKNIVAK